MTLKLLDLFCGAGGASVGLQRAGFDVEGVDIKPQPHYPFKFYQADALEFPLKGYDAYWASPPCQRYTQMLNHGLTPRTKHPDLIEITRNLLKDTNKLFIIENVPGAPLINPVMLCGEMFNLRVTRHRYFEANIPLLQLLHPKHKGTGIRKQNDDGYYYRVYGHETGKASWGAAMGIDWMRSPELAQSCPPSYAKYIGEQLIQYLSHK